MTARETLLNDCVRLAEDQATEPEARALAQLAGELNARGMLRSSAFVELRHRRRVETVVELLAERLRAERAYPLSPETIGDAHAALVANIHGVAHRQSIRLSTAIAEDWTEACGGALPDTVRCRPANDIGRLCDQRLKEADIIRQEREMGVKPAQSSSITVNVSQSYVAALNLGEVVGRIQGTVNVLNAAGQGELANAIKALAEAIAAEPGLLQDAKAEAMDVIADLSAELTHDRKPSRLRASWSRIVQLTGDVAKIAALSEPVKAGVRALGFDLP